MCNWHLKPAFSCHVCNSTESCSKDLTNVDQYKKICRPLRKSSSELCFSVIDENNQIHRGCYNEKPQLCDTFSSKCVKCRGNYCNTQPVIKSALVCFSCSHDDKQCAIERSTKSVTTKCLDHFQGQAESCFDILSKRTNLTERGCTLDLPSSRLQSPKLAVTSYCDSHFCNSEGHAVRKCLTCTGHDLNSKCHELGSDAARMVTQCNTVPGQMEASSCYTLFWNRTTIQRGCQVNLGKQEALFCNANLNQFCHICSNDTCNTVKLWYESCLICHQNCTRRVQIGSSVSYEGVGLTPKTCEKVSTSERNGCFLRVLGKHEREWKQGCVADMREDEYGACLRDLEKGSCVICSGSRCNNKLKEVPRLQPVQVLMDDGTSGTGRVDLNIWLGVTSVLLRRFW